MFSFFSKLFGPKVDFKALVEDGALILDVRTPEEFNGGHIQGSVNIPVQIIASKVNDLRKRGKPIITVCRSGARSGTAASILKSAGIEAFNGGPWNRLERELHNR
ncbi:MAG: rhodanese-like domain-containing protein [Saprospirales bacterium]|nr:rhodanese-like domain-containing protein [Saprospirales bacterium]MBK8922883.1 rhodanese-like domain-containing protein [Saprospirales bacterium]